MIDTRTAPYAALALRLGLGLMLLAHGLLKVFVFTVPGTVGFFGSLGLPAVFAYLTILGEIGGGLLILAGLRTRWIALAVLPILLGATVVHAGNGWLFSAEGGGWEYPAFLSLAAIVQARRWAGAVAFSSFCARRAALDNA